MILGCTAESTSTERYALLPGLRESCFAQHSFFACEQASKPPDAEAPRSKNSHPLLRFCAPPAISPWKSGRPRLTSPGTFRPWPFEAFGGFLLPRICPPFFMQAPLMGFKEPRCASGIPSTWLPRCLGASPIEIGLPTAVGGEQNLCDRTCSSHAWHSTCRAIHHGRPWSTVGIGPSNRTMHISAEARA